ncbi:hypothetical protein VTL71DRAFT_9802 [Oculimacula yallundae]|uniref:DUF7908 domain-containing protein n=1 Tax=Oculimacula yallundae TaxID=86028 RepID=A0ABR4BQH6_9HELO
MIGLTPPANVNTPPPLIINTPPAVAISTLSASASDSPSSIRSGVTSTTANEQASGNDSSSIVRSETFSPISGSTPLPTAGNQPSATRGRQTDTLRSSDAPSITPTVSNESSSPTNTSTSPANIAASSEIPLNTATVKNTTIIIAPASETLSITSVVGDTSSNTGTKVSLTSILASDAPLTTAASARTFLTSFTTPTQAAGLFSIAPSSDTRPGVTPVGGEETVIPIVFSTSVITLPSGSVGFSSTLPPNGTTPGVVIVGVEVTTNIAVSSTSFKPLPSGSAGFTSTLPQVGETPGVVVVGVVATPSDTPPSPSSQEFYLIIVPVSVKRRRRAFLDSRYLTYDGSTLRSCSSANLYSLSQGFLFGGSNPFSAPSDLKPLLLAPRSTVYDLTDTFSLINQQLFWFNPKFDNKRALFCQLPNNQVYAVFNAKPPPSCKLVDLFVLPESLCAKKSPNTSMTDLSPGISPTSPGSTYTQLSTVTVTRFCSCISPVTITFDPTSPESPVTEVVANPASATTIYEYVTTTIGWPGSEVSTATLLPSGPSQYGTIVVLTSTENQMYTAGTSYNSLPFPTSSAPSSLVKSSTNWNNVSSSLRSEKSGTSSVVANPSADSGDASSSPPSGQFTTSSVVARPSADSDDASSSMPSGQSTTSSTVPTGPQFTSSTNQNRSNRFLPFVITLFTATFLCFF